MITEKFLTVYGPVTSWRYGRSLGIDPIGSVSTCSFNCIYCQLGEIEQLTTQRRIFVPTATIIQDLKAFSPWNVDVITLSGSGEPTLALNLGEIITEIQGLTPKKIVVLTNGTLLNSQTVRDELANCSIVSVKLDGIVPEQLIRINRPVSEINLPQLWQGIKQFRSDYSGKLGIQTMVLQAWDSALVNRYIQLMIELKPDEIQLNIPSRPSNCRLTGLGREGIFN
jgi:wyosine [tRNA(Phe)-imidazoG37] synthetase (radical SAM superfamily)